MNNDGIIKVGSNREAVWVAVEQNEAMQRVDDQFQGTFDDLRKAHTAANNDYYDHLYQTGSSRAGVVRRAAQSIRSILFK